MPAGSFIAALIAFFALIAGSAVVAGIRGEEFGAVSDLLFSPAAGASLTRTALAWGWLVLGLAAIAGAFMAFVSDEADDPRVQRRRFPVAAPVIALMAAFGVVWAMLAPGKTYVAEGSAFVPAPPVSDIDDALAGGQVVIAPLDPVKPVPPIAPPEPTQPTPAEKERIIEVAKPLTASEETAFYWTYEFPQIRDGAVVSSPEVDRALAAFMPMDDGDGSVARLLCGKAWVAFSGSASEEGPLDRNEMRARARAELVAARAKSWLDAHPQCERPVIVALDLGQHKPTETGDPARTAYQRQLIVIGRARAAADEVVDAAAAVEEMRIFYGSENMRERLLGARHYSREASVFVP